MGIIQLIYTFQIISEIDVVLPCGLQLPSVGYFPLHAHYERHIHLHYGAISSPCPILIHAHPNAYSNSDIRRYRLYPLIILSHSEAKEVELSHHIHVHHLRFPRFPGCANWGRERLARGELPLDMMRQALHLQRPSLVELIAKMQTIRLAHILKHIFSRIAHIVSASALQSQLTAIHPLRLRAHAGGKSDTPPQYNISQSSFQL